MSGTASANTVVLASGEGTNLQALIDASRSGTLASRICAVFADRRDARALDRARAAGIEAQFVGRTQFPNRAAYESALGDAIDAQAPAAVVLAGFMRVLGPDFVRRFEGRMLNLHPSLLPKFRGLETHTRVLAAGEAWHGATVHFVTDELDAGPPVLQYRLKVRSSDTPDSLAARVHAGEHMILPQAVGWLAAGRLELRGGAAWLDARRLEEPVVREAE